MWKGDLIMCYKADLQRKNEEKLQEKFAEDSVPMFIREAVVLRISSRQARLNAWATVKAMLLKSFQRKAEDTLAISMKNLSMFQENSL